MESILSLVNNLSTIKAEDIPFEDGDKFHLFFGRKEGNAGYGRVEVGVYSIENGKAFLTHGSEDVLVKIHLGEMNEKTIARLLNYGDHMDRNSDGSAILVYENKGKELFRIVKK